MRSNKWINFSNSSKKNYIISNKAEYRSSDNVKTFEAQDFTNIPGFIESIRNIHIKQGKDIIFNDLEKYLDENNLRGTFIENFYREYGFISSAAINIYYGNLFFGNLIITFEKHRNITEDEIKFIKTLADQTGIALYQSQLYESVKQRAKKEALLKEIVIQIKLSQNIDQVYEYIISKIGKEFKATRVIFFETPTYKYISPVVKYEFLSDKSLSSFGIFNPEKVKNLLDKIENGGLISEIDQMAIVGILSTQLLYKKFILEPIVANPLKLRNYKVSIR